MWIVYCAIWLLFGVLGCLIYNKHFTYESKELKYVWNIIVCPMGIVGLFVACLTWITFKLDKKKNDGRTV